MYIHAIDKFAIDKTKMNAGFAIIIKGRKNWFVRDTKETCGTDNNTADDLRSRMYIFIGLFYWWFIFAKFDWLGVMLFNAQLGGRRWMQFVICNF